MLHCSAEELLEMGDKISRSMILDKMNKTNFTDKRAKPTSQNRIHNLLKPKQAAVKRVLNKSNPSEKSTADPQSSSILDRKVVSDAIESAVKERTQELYRKANFDTLTHLPNRRYFHEMLDDLVKKYESHQHPFTLLFLDLDGFKKVNDSLGHALGDELLRHVSARLVASVRMGDVVARLGGDEFVILLDETADKETIEMICKRIIRDVSRSFYFTRTEVKISASIGIASFPKDAVTSAELIQNADEALYKAKHAGRRTYRFYGEMPHETHSEEDISQAQFEEAVASQAIEIKATPQVNLSGNQLTGAALSLSWPGSELSSNDFGAWSALLQKSGWDHSVGVWLLDSARHYLKLWQKSSPNMSVSVPVIEAVWRSENFIAILNQKIADSGLSPRSFNLIFELSDLVTYDVLFVQMLKSLKSHGYQITMRGYGEVSFDLALMSDLEVDCFLINREWALEMMQKTDKNWVEALIAMANVLSVEVMIKGELSIEEALRFKLMGADASEANQWLMTDKIDTFTKAVGEGLITAA